MAKYCLGYAFDEAYRYVVLLQKQWPEELKNNWTGVGGRVEENESYLSAMVREFYEETGVESDVNDWKFLADVYCHRGGDSRYFPDEAGLIGCYYTNKLDIEQARTVTDEPVEVYPVDRVLAHDFKMTRLTPLLVGLACNHEQHSWKILTRAHPDAEIF